MAPIKKGKKVRLIREKFEKSVEALASDPRLPDYVFDGTAEVVDIKGDYAQVQFLTPTPNAWLPIEHLEAV